MGMSSLSSKESAKPLKLGTKSRAKWIHSRDRNTTYFHTIALVRRNKNKLGALKNSEGEWITDSSHLKQHVVHHFQELYTGGEEENSRLDLVNTFQNLSQVDLELLHTDLSSDEIELAIKSIGPHKAPGPDGFQACFFQKKKKKKNWDLVQKDVSELVSIAFSTSKLRPDINKTLITLIPKWVVWSNNWIPRFQNSKIYITPNTAERTSRELERINGIPRTKDLGRYLEVPLIHKRVTQKTYWYLIEKVQARLASWKEMNLAFLAKLGWRMMETNDHLWQQVLVHKYLNTSLDQERRHKGYSYTWKSILEGKKVLERRLKWRVGDGTQINFWHDKWVKDGRFLAQLLFLPAHENQDSILVSDFINEYGWRNDLLLDALPMEIVNKINCILVNAANLLPDRIIWSHTADGTFTTKTAYMSLTDNNEVAEPYIKAIWKYKVQPKIQTFIWLACQNRILCNENRIVRNLISDPKCSICGAHYESVIHVLRVCPKVEAIWKTFMIDPRFHSSWNMTLKQWESLMLGNSRSDPSFQQRSQPFSMNAALQELSEHANEAHDVTRQGVEFKGREALKMRSLTNSGI
ncbi:hypothetical protein COLO4_21884 [Corchorus olitorius]|uniref:Reverse transcriptase zinc-binding domain-containing protein n=1 Tax=Corchorus olitorius TaxID=93759 RepID=A0A1R3IQ74_9ROSI|nr:hypothetical protein COLO4_21884 [Corchorus olitorius]